MAVLCLYINTHLVFKKKKKIKITTEEHLDAEMAVMKLEIVFRVAEMLLTSDFSLH